MEHHNSPSPPERSQTQHSSRSRLSPEEREQAVHLHHHGYGTRSIARRLGRDRKAVRRALLEEGLELSPSLPSPAPSGSSKLHPFRAIVDDKVRKGLTTTRILREIRSLGFRGGRTILGDYVRAVRRELAPPPAPRRRFETPPGEELQVDWTVYSVPIDGRLERVHALAVTLAFSRLLHVHFYRNEREPVLLEGLACAFEAFQGAAQRTVVDNMATAVLGRFGPRRQPVWHPRFEEFCRHYGTRPYACRVRDPNRKGVVERVLDYLEKDFVRGAEFASFAELNERVHRWTDEIANRRVHGTTGRVPLEAWEEERSFLIALPDARFPVHTEEIRTVGPTSTLSLDGTLYTVPSTLGEGPVSVRLFAEHFEVLDSSGKTAFHRPYVGQADKGRLQLDPSHYPSLERRGPEHRSGQRLDELLRQRFPDIAPLLEGILRRMKSLAPVHLRLLWRLAGQYGESDFLAAARRAQSFRRYSAEAVRRILEQRVLPLDPELPLTPLHPAGRANEILGEVDGGSLEDYAHLDRISSDGTAPTEEPSTKKGDDDGTP